jgi:hypothetical protein
MRPRRATVAVLLLATACYGEDVPLVTGTPPTVTTVPPSPTTTTMSPPPTVAPVELPRGTPASYRPDDEPGDVPPEALVPADAVVTGTWYERTAGGADVILVAFSRGADPFASEHALLAWMRFADAPHWRPAIAVDERPRAGVLGITVETGDATGDGSPDALVFAATGGSGACGTRRLLDLATRDVVWVLAMTCDTSVTFTVDPAGLEMVEALFRTGDPHCCPSRLRTSQLEFDGETMVVTDRRVEEVD